MKKKAIEFSLKAEKQDFPIEKIRNSENAADFARKFYHEDMIIYESAFILLLNQASNTIGFAKISQGGVCGTVVDIRIVAKYAIETLAASVILVHNHPSGNCNPSNDDIRLSKNIKETLKLFNVKFLDSLILTENDYYSLNDEGDL